MREVRDAHHCLIKFEYESDNNWSSQPGFTLWPDSAHHKRKFIFIIRDSWLRQIRMLSRDGFEDAHWMFDYQPSENGGPLITHMQTPLGAVETLRYAVNGHALPIGAPVDFVPVVLSWTVAPGLGLRPTTRVYDFSSTNYFGYGRVIFGVRVEILLIKAPVIIRTPPEKQVQRRGSQDSQRGFTIASI